MNTSTRSAIRKAAIAAGAATRGWSDEEFRSWAEANRPDLIGGDAPVTPTPTPTPAPEGDDRLQLLQSLLSGGITEDRVKQIVAEAMGQPAPIIRRDVTLTKPDGSPVATIERAHKQFETVLRIISSGTNVNLVGPAGSGKSHMLRDAAKALSLDYYYQGAMQVESKVLGYMTATGSYVSTPFRKAYEFGGLFVLEEADSCSPKAVLALNNIVASTVGDFPDGLVEKHKDFRCALACNTFGRGATMQYSGRNPLDESSLNRFPPLHIDYDLDLERDLALAMDPEAGSWVDRVQAVRERAVAAGLRVVISPRNTFHGIQWRLAGVPEETIIEGCLFAGMTADERAQVVA